MAESSAVTEVGVKSCVATMITEVSILRNRREPSKHLVGWNKSY